MSHEIRTPMNGVIGMTELALGTDLNAKQRDYLETVKASADALLVVINDILDFSKIEAGKLELERVAFSLRETMAFALKPLAPRAAAKGLELVWVIQPGVPDRLIGDPIRLRQVLVNLVGNAIKFTGQGRVIVTVGGSAMVDGGDVVPLSFEVRDTGIGIPPEKHAAIFHAFEQADGSTTRKYGGTGLGLAISSQLVELMGGRIQVKSTPGVGSAFSFTARLEMGCDAPAVSARPARTVTAGRRLHILLAEDNIVNQRLAVRLLEKQGHIVRVVADGASALTAWRERPFDIVLMDVQMPVMDGFQATAALRAEGSETGRHTPIAAMTAHAMKGDRERCLDAGMDAYLSKPLNVGVLYAVLGRLCPPEAAGFCCDTQREAVASRL